MDELRNGNGLGQRKPDVRLLKERHTKMQTLPFLRTQEMTDNLNGAPKGRKNILVATIVAAPNLESWADEYHKDWQAEELTSVEAMAITLTDNPESFWAGNQHPVKLTEIGGPAGPLYAVEDGSHRVAAAKLAEVAEIPAEVEDLTDRKEFPTSSETTLHWWQALLATGIVKGKIQERGNEHILMLDEVPPLPWIVRSRINFAKINTVYRQVYGEKALTGFTGIPQEILSDNGQLMVWENTTLRSASGHT